MIYRNHWWIEWWTPENPQKYSLRSPKRWVDDGRWIQVCLKIGYPWLPHGYPKRTSLTFDHHFPLRRIAIWPIVSCYDAVRILGLMGQSCRVLAQSPEWKGGQDAMLEYQESVRDPGTQLKTSQLTRMKTSMKKLCQYVLMNIYIYSYNW